MNCCVDLPFDCANLPFDYTSLPFDCANLPFDCANLLFTVATIYTLGPNDNTGLRFRAFYPKDEFPIDLALFLDAEFKTNVRFSQLVVTFEIINFKS